MGHHRLNGLPACHLSSLHRDSAGVAQLVERKALNLVVKGSSPFFGGTLGFYHQTRCCVANLAGTAWPPQAKFVRMWLPNVNGGHTACFAQQVMPKGLVVSTTSCCEI